MSGGLEAAGDAITGAVIARAVEPTHDVDDGHTHESACLNCATPLLGSHCHNCGQAAHLHRSLVGLWHDIAHGVFHFEGKVWRTLPMLALRPGSLTRRYIHGQRARFVSPLALFLFSVFLMFAVFGSVGLPFKPNVTHNGSEITSANFDTELAKATTLVTTLERMRATAVSRGQSTRETDAALSKARDDLRGLRALTSFAKNGVTGAIPDEDLSKNVRVNTGSSETDARVKAAFKNPKLLIYKVQSSAYKFAWALIPMSLPFLWLMFAWRRQYKLYDHAVFITYSLCAVILLLVAMSFVAATGIDTDWAMLLVPVHMFVQLKGAYALSTFSALWRTAVLTQAATLVLGGFVVGLVIIGALG